MKGGGHTQRRRFSLQALCVVHSPNSEEETSTKLTQTKDDCDTTFNHRPVG